MAVHHGVDPFESDFNSDSVSDGSVATVDIGVASGWAQNIPDFDVVVTFIRFMKKSAEQKHLEQAIQDVCDDLEQEHRVSSS